MADDLNKKGPKDKTRVNLNQKWEIEYWKEKLGTTEAKLRQAIKAVGPMVVDIRIWLRDN